MRGRLVIAAAIVTGWAAAPPAPLSAQGFATGGGPALGSSGPGFAATFAWNFESGRSVRLGTDVDLGIQGAHRSFSLSLLLGHRFVTHRDFVPYVSAGLSNSHFLVSRRVSDVFETGSASRTTPVALVGLDLGRGKFRVAVEGAYAPSVVVPTFVYRGLRTTPREERVQQLTVRVLLVFGMKEE